MPSGSTVNCDDTIMKEGQIALHHVVFSILGFDTPSPLSSTNNPFQPPPHNQGQKPSIRLTNNVPPPWPVLPVENAGSTHAFGQLSYLYLYEQWIWNA